MITEKLEGINIEKNVEIIVPLKYLTNFWRTLDMLLINCEVSLNLTWHANCVITDKIHRVAGANNNPAGINNPTNAIFNIKDTKLYVSVGPLTIEDDNNLLRQLKTGFKRTIKWNKCRSNLSNQIKNNNLNYLIRLLINLTDYLFYHLKMKMIKHLLVNIIHLLLKLNIIMY